MTSTHLQIQRTLRGDSNGASLTTLVIAGVLMSAAYGTVMGSFWGVGAYPRLWQMLYSGLKVPLLLGITFALSVPSFFVLNTLAGLRDDFPRVLRALSMTQAAVAAVLLALSPLTLLWYVSSASYDAAISANALMFLAASASGQFVLRQRYAPLIARNRNHARLLAVWLVVYGFVGVQMGWVLRPFIGNPGKPTEFFRQGAWGNAYVELTRIIYRTLGGD